MSVCWAFSAVLHNRRTAFGLTQKEMSELCNISLRHYQEWELGHSLPTLAHAVYIAKAIGISLDALTKAVEINESSEIMLKRVKKNNTL